VNYPASQHASQGVTEYALTLLPTNHFSSTPLVSEAEMLTAKPAFDH